MKHSGPGAQTKPGPFIAKRHFEGSCLELG